jgi:hypothetical protein
MNRSLQHLNPFSMRARRSDASKQRDRALRPLVDGLEQRELLSTVKVSGQANIYGAGLKNPPAPGGGGGGVLPVPVSLSVLGSPKSVVFPTATGTVSGWAARGGYNGPDGGSYWGGVTNVPAWKGISGIQDNHTTMFLVGVFLGPNGQPAKAPANLNVTNGHNVASVSPLIGQQFFIGDGRTNAGALQSFNVPTGATSLYLGFAESFGFGNPNLQPGYYDDNGGMLTVDVESSSALPDVVMDSVTTTDARTVTATYDVKAADIKQPLTFNIYRSSSATSYSSSDLIATDTLSATDTADLSAGHHQVKLTVYYASDMAPDPHRPFTIVVANPGKTFQEQNYANDTAYFQKFVLGIVSHGYILPSSNPNGLTPDWELTMANTLKSVDGYNQVIAFNWVKASGDPRSNQAVFAGATLANQVAVAATKLESTHTGDVVDMHFIGHSRGSVVISQAIQDLMKANQSLIQGSFIRMTMLDPHPATNYTTPYYNASAIGSISLLKQIISFQTAAVDPPVVVPMAVNYAEVFFQHTSASAFTGVTNIEGYVNLWGQGNDGSIVNNSSVNIAFHPPLTSKTYAGIGPIGHYEVHDYYQKFVVDYGLSLRYT